MQDNNQEESYNDLAEYLAHQQSWVEQELGEQLAAVLKEELDIDRN